MKTTRFQNITTCSRVLQVCVVFALAEFPAASGGAADWVLSRRINDSRLLSLVRQPAVLAELSLSAAQQKEIRQFNDQLDAELLPLRNRRREDVLPGYGQLTTKTKQELKLILTARQFNRLAQIMFHVRGTRAVSTGKLASQLTISERQKKEIAAIVEQTTAETAARRQADDYVNVSRLLARLGDEDQQVLAVLSDAQRARLARMSGHRFDRALLSGMRFKAPRFVDGHWLQTAEPLELTRLRSQVVVVHFWAFG